MKKLIGVCLLALSALATAQTPADAARDAARDAAATERDATSAKRDAERAKRDAEDAKVRAELAKARAELDRAAQEVAELSMKLSGANDFVIRTGGPRHAMLGVQIDSESGKEGARVRSVSPGGPAEEAGLKTGDVIVSLDGKAISGSADSGRVLVEHMRDVKPEQKVKVRVLRSGKNKDVVVVARPMVGFAADNRMFNVRVPEVGAIAMRGPMGEEMPFFRQFRGGFFHGEFNGLELASITPKLGAYFGANDGVLVVSAPENDAFKLEDGDVIQAIDGRKPGDGAHALRILRSYKSGEKLNLTVLRQRKPVTLAVTMPERQDFEEGILMSAPMTAPMPALPPLPAVPPAGAAAPGTSTLE
jgi:C-terminal processing protease CtpA/Prc